VKATTCSFTFFRYLTVCPKIQTATSLLHGSTAWIPLRVCSLPCYFCTPSFTSHTPLQARNHYLLTTSRPVQLSLCNLPLLRFYRTMEFKARERSMHDTVSLISEDSEKLSSILNGELVFAPVPIRDLRQSMFRRPLPFPPISPHTAKKSTFQIYHATIETAKTARGGSKNRMLGYDDATPKDEAPSYEDSTHIDDNFSFDEIFNPIEALEDMDDHFSFWTRNKEEGTSAIPYVLAGVKGNAHASISERERKLWSDSEDDITGDSDVKNADELNEMTSEEEHAAKRISLSLIERIKASKNSSVLTVQSANAKRSTRQKTKRRKPLRTGTAASSTQAKREAEQGDVPIRKPTIVKLIGDEIEQQRAVAAALMKNQIDLNREEDILALMRVLSAKSSGNYKSDIDQTSKEVYEVFASSKVLSSANTT
jgi:hypothetical protein